MQITICNQQNLIKFNYKNIKNLTRFFVEQVKQNTSFAYDHITLMLVNDGGIRRYKLEFFDKNEFTDVIAIPQYLAFPTKRKVADIIINIELALREAKRRNIMFEEEFALYLAHAIDHLGGANDDTLSERKAMLKLESLWVRFAKQKKLLSGLSIK